MPVSPGHVRIRDEATSPSSWQGPVAFLCLGLFLALIGMWLWPRREDAADPAL